MIVKSKDAKKRKFMGASFEEARERVRRSFDKVRIIRPEGTRKSSYEVFLVGIGASADPR